MSDSPMSRTTKLAADTEGEKPSSGFPLGALFLLTAVSCIVAAHLLPVWRGYEAGAVDGQDLKSAVVVASLAFLVPGAFLGLLLGLHYSPVWLGIVCGGGTGLVLGAVVGPILCTPAERFGELALTSVVGSIVLVGLGIVLRPRVLH